MKKNNRYEYEKAQETIIISAHQRKTIHNIFSNTIEFLEKYIEIAGYYPDWENRKQFFNNEVIREDIVGKPEEAEKWFSITLFGLRQALQDKPEFFHNELKAEFYQWINATKIDVNNCPSRLKQILFGFHEILEGRGEKIMEDVISRRDKLDVDAPNYAEKINNFLSVIQIPLEKGREEEKLLKSRSYDDVEIESKFKGGSSEQGERDFGQIAGVAVGEHNNFHFFKQKTQQQSNLTGGIIDNDTEMTDYSNESSTSQPTGEYKWVNDQGWVFFPFQESSKTEDYKKQDYKQNVSDRLIDKSDNKNNNLGTISLITIILTLASLVAYGIVKKSKKVKKSR